MNKKQLAVVAFLAGAGAAAMNGAASAHADTLPPAPPSTELAAVSPAGSVRARILDIAHQEFSKQNPGTFYSEGIRQAWCANFVSWVMNQAGDPLNNVLNGSWRVPGVYTLRDTFQSENKFEPRGYKPSPGDVVLYGGSGHTNIVVGVDGDNITTIGGNEGNRISQRTISRFSNNIMGFGRVEDTVPLAQPAPAPEPAPAPPAPEFVAPPAPPADPFLPPPPPAPAPEFVAPPAPPADPFLPPPPPPAPEFVAPPAPVAQEVPPPPPADPFLPPPPAPEFVAPAPGDVPPPPVDPFLPPPPPAPEFVAPPAPVDPFLPPPPPPVEFAPPAPEVIPAVFDAPPPPPAPETMELSAPADGIPHLSGALPGPAA